MDPIATDAIEQLCGKLDALTAQRDRLLRAAKAIEPVSYRPMIDSAVVSWTRLHELSEAIREIEAAKEQSQ